MVLLVHVMLCMTESDFLKKYFYPRNGENVPKIGSFEFIGKSSHFFSEFSL